MQKIINFIRGSVRLTVTGAFPERFLNLCAQNGVGFWALIWLDNQTLTLRLARKDVAQGEALAEKVMCDVRTERKQGIPFFLARFKRRYALLLGFCVAIGAVCVLSQFILTVDVSGNEQVPTAQILAALDHFGVRPGVYGPAINEREVGHQVLLDIPELSWMAINLHGARAEVLVREKRPKPEIVDTSKPSHVVATVSGIITRMEVLDGRPLFRAGDTVLAGETIISGTMDIREPKWSETDLGVRVVHAMGRVWARTFRTLTAQVPMTAQVKDYTGESQTRFSLTLFGQRVNFYGNASISMDKYDKITTTHPLTLPGGWELPICVTTERYRGYETASVPLNRSVAEELLETHLESRLAALVTDGDVRRVDMTASLGENILTVTLLAECDEQIGRVTEFAGEIGNNPPGAAGAV